MKHHEATEYARNRGRVTNTTTGTTGNLVDWLPGQYCKVFTGYSPELAGHIKLPMFETWLKSETVKESNTVPISNP